MEYSVPIEAGAECVREILKTIYDRAIDVAFPLEYRYVSGDDPWLSMAYGAEPHATILYSPNCKRGLFTLLRYHRTHLLEIRRAAALG